MNAKTLTIPREQSGLRLDIILSRYLPEFSRARIQALIKEGHVLVDGQPCKARQTTKESQVVRVEIPEPRAVEMEPEPMNLAVLHEDDDLLVLNKPSGLVVHPGAGHGSGTLVHGLLAHCSSLSGIGGELRPGIVHRLDKETSGCLVIAKNDLAHRELSRQFASREVIKQYLAVAKGRPTSPRFRAENYLGRHPVNRKKMAVVEEGQGKLAHTEFECLRTVGNATLILCHLFTGRTHQIRVHLSHLGHPILGDELYGHSRGSGYLGRLLLHSRVLGFRHPSTQEDLRFEADIPLEFADWLGE